VVFLLRRRPGAEPLQAHTHCALTAWATEPQTWTCAHCGGAGGAIGGPGQTWTIGGRDVWLHQSRCEAAYYEAHADELPPWEPPEDRPPEPPDQDASPW
jgi:hypothetical protein